METYIKITTLNDFVFCPRSIYFHNIYSNYSDESYKDTPQKVGTLKHENIDNKNYSTSKHIIQSISVFSDKYNVAGKIDIFDKKTGYLIERKTKIVKIYDGYLYQIWAQYFCLKEMGYNVKKLFLHSLIDNKRYEIPIPNFKDIKKFENILDEIRNFDLNKNFTQNPLKCKNCIYSDLCDIKI